MEEGGERRVGEGGGRKVGRRVGEEGGRGGGGVSIGERSQS